MQLSKVTIPSLARPAGTLDPSRTGEGGRRVGKILSKGDVITVKNKEGGRRGP